MIDSEEGADLRRPPLWPGLLALAGALLFTVGYLRTTSRWWYEDDPAQYASAAAIGDPSSIFVSPSLLRGFGTGASLVPMQLFSYWVDIHLFGPAPRPAYLHSLVSTLLTVFLVYLVLARMTGDPAASSCLALLWLALPSTIAVQSFLSTRHYMEGLGWSLAAGYFLDRLCGRRLASGVHLVDGRQERPGWEPGVLAALAVTCACAAMLSKELYVIALPFWLLIYSLGRRRYGMAAGSALLAMAYVGYRLAILGTHAVYPVPPASGRAYLQYLIVLPYTFGANRGGYVYYALLGAGSAALLLRRRSGAPGRILLAFSLLAAALIPCYPTARAVLLTYRTPGTWYRAVFLVNTIVLLAGGGLLVRYTGRTLKIAGLAALVVILVPGARETRRLWDERLTRSETEGKFYLANPDKLVYSEEDAAWFLYGLERLYGVPRSHYVHKAELAGPRAKEMIREFPGIWRYRDGRWGVDDELYGEIARRNEDGAPGRRPAGKDPARVKG